MVPRATSTFTRLLLVRSGSSKRIAYQAQPRHALNKGYDSMMLKHSCYTGQSTLFDGRKTTRMRPFDSPITTKSPHLPQRHHPLSTGARNKLTFMSASKRAPFFPPNMRSLQCCGPAHDSLWQSPPSRPCYQARRCLSTLDIVTQLHIRKSTLD